MNIKFNCGIMKCNVKSLTDLLNMSIVFRDMASGGAVKRSRSAPWLKLITPALLEV